MAKPRTITGAAKRGWHTVTIPRQKHLSWIGILVCCNRITKRADFISEYDFQGGGTLAFEDQKAWLKVKFYFNIL